MKKIVIIALVATVLAGGGIYFKNQSSYAEYEKLQAGKNVAGETVGSGGNDDENQKGEGESQSGKPEAEDERTPDDIALDKRLDEERKRNEKTYREQGVAGSAFRPTIKIPRFSMDELIDIYETLQAYIRENPERFPEPADDGTTRRTPDPRIENNLYAEEKSGVIKGFEDENLVAMEVKKLDGEYVIIILARDSKEDEWRILAEGDVYKLRKEMTNGN